MNFSNENLLIIIILISIVIMFLTSDSICKNKEQFADTDNARQTNTYGPSRPSVFEDVRVCDEVKCGGRTPEICTGGECIPVTTGGTKYNSCKYKMLNTCVGGIEETPRITDPCGKKTEKICTGNDPKCCDVRRLKIINK